MSRKGGLNSGGLALIRSIVGAPAVADNASLVDANYDITQAIDCRGYDTIWVGVEFAGGASPTAIFEILFRDPDAADGLRWKKVLVGAPAGITQIGTPVVLATTALDGTALHELRVDGRLVFIRCKTLANNPTTVNVLAMGGVRRLVQNDVE